jgi:small-conductance mechanosensitive channel
MDLVEVILDPISKFIPLIAVSAGGLLLLILINHFLAKGARRAGITQTFSRPLIMLVLTAVFLVCVIIVSPMTDELRGNFFTLLGVVLTAIIALSSTTFVANAMAGLMMRAVNAFRPGDFVRVADQFGRVTERGLFHTEIQTEDRDLTTLPNLYLISNPFTVVRSSGTIVSASVSLGYDTSHAVIEPVLLQAARDADLNEPFVRILELGDFTVTYRVSGFLADVKQLLSSRSKLHELVLDNLHGAGIEIASPSIMLQRPMAADAQILPPTPPRSAPQKDDAPRDTESLIFDKAEQAANLENLRLERETIAAELVDLNERSARASKEERTRLQSAISTRKKRSEAITEILEANVEIPDASGPASDSPANAE